MTFGIYNCLDNYRFTIVQHTVNVVRHAYHIYSIQFSLLLKGTELSLSVREVTSMKVLDKMLALRKQRTIWLKIALILFIAWICLHIFIVLDINKLKVENRSDVDIREPRHEFIQDR